MPIRRGRRNRGSVLLMVAVAMITLIGGAGMVLDVGRMYIAKAESQTFVDAAALAALRELDTTADGVSRAVTAAKTVPWKRWHFGSNSFDTVDVRFCAVKTCDWASAPNGPPDTGFRFVRVESTVAVPIYLMHVLSPGATKQVRAYAVAGMEKMSSFTGGTFPFFAAAKDAAAGTAEPSGCGHCGFIEGESYTFRWSNRAGNELVTEWNKYQNSLTRGEVPPYDVSAGLVKQGWCSGDTTMAAVTYFVDNLDLSNPSGLFSNKGFFLPADVKGGTATISDAVEGGYQTQGYAIGTDIEYAELMEGTRQAIEKDIQARIQHELDLAEGFSTNDVVAYKAGLTAQAAMNLSVHSRIVIVPVVEASAYDKGATSAEVIDFLPFLLLTDKSEGANAYGGPNTNWCMKYLGSINFATGAPVPGGTGVYYPRLVE